MIYYVIDTLPEGYLISTDFKGEIGDTVEIEFEDESRFYASVVNILPGPGAVVRVRF